MNFKKILSLLATLWCVSNMDASAFAIRLNDPAAMGLAEAGGAAIAENASTVFYNPAGMTRICGTELQMSISGVRAFTKFHNDDSTYLLGGFLDGDNGHDAGSPGALASSFFMTKELGCNLWAGLGISAPFGLVTDYGHEWVGRYYAIRSAITTVNINPSVAYKINDCFSIGVGFNAMYAHLKNSSAIDFGLIGFLISPELGLVPQQNDGIAIIKSNAWGYGGNVGILYEWSPCTRFGAQYRSSTYLHGNGDEKFKNVPVQLSGAPDFQDKRADVRVRLPASASLSAFHQLNHCWAIMGDVTWTGWSCIKKLKYTFEEGTQDPIVTTLKWKDAMRYALGTQFTPNCCWTYRAGIAFDQHVHRNKELVTPRVPENDRWIFGLGVGYALCDCLKLDVGYEFETVKRLKIDKTGFELEEDFLRGGLRGHWNTHIHVLGAQVIYNF